MLLEINTENPDRRKIQKVKDILEKGGVIIYPTDTVYGLGCDIFNQKAVQKICRLRQLNPAKANLTFICKEISQLASFANQIDNTTFKLLKRNLPGAFTFLFKASSQLPKLLKNKRKTIGVRIPDNRIAIAIVEALERPILSISLKETDDIVEFLTDPTEIHDEYANQVACVIDGGVGGNEPSTIVDCTGSDYQIIRQGKGELI